nr:hypothetical protein BaRGS_015964 [Batillaria attramentaria]
MLTSQLEARSEELRRANAHKMAVIRERDELLALLDIKERSRYENSHSQSSEEEYGQYSTMEGKTLQQRRDEAYMTVDAYRLAFEEQLQKSRMMTQQLATIATTSSRAVKTKAAIKWLISVLADANIYMNKIK